MALMEFYQNKHCRLMRANDAVGSGWVSFKGANWTACFLLRVDSLWKDGPGLVWAFGMDSVATLAWCHRLVSTDSELLEHRGFTMARMEYTEAPDQYLDLEWTTESALDVVLQTPGPRVVMPEDQSLRKSAKDVRARKKKEQQDPEQDGGNPGAGSEEPSEKGGKSRKKDS